MHSIGTTSLWTAFTLIVLAALVVDFLVLRSGGPHRVSFREALVWSLAWVGLALAFNLGLWWWLDGQAGRAVANDIALEFLTGYVVEKSLAVDNIFVFLMIFNYFAVPAEQRQRALMLGVLGAIVLRAILIFIGAALVAKFHWILYLFGLFLIVTGVKMLLAANQEPDLEANPMLRWIRKHLPLTKEFHGSALRVLDGGKHRYTPLFVVMLLIAVTDVIFAVDSIPAIFAVTEDPFVVLTSNVFAVLGLRAMFFLLAGAAERFHLLSYGLAAVLLFIGTKMLIADVYKIPIGIALGVVALLIGASIVASLRFPPRRDAG
ncbi:TerC family protein [Dokdonella sp.]|uniref:TerC family protein n=1 Tax=Dokdonella sp. TaxID=2291710 RepID=UPI001B133739|nr:TerC family protein [Dokdonella sp.]MBO9661506.1 TerC family protein [Dokdonella sp.]